LYDVVLRDSLFTTLNVVLDDNSWTQAFLPVRCGGLGFRGIRPILLAPSAYLLSAACTIELTSTLLSLHLQTADDSGGATAMSAWKRQVSSSNSVGGRTE